MTRSCLIPLNNVTGKGDYCAEIDVGSTAQRQHVLLDTGSSSLVLNNHTYAPEQDTTLQATTLCQHMRYGIGEWVGPVVKTRVSLGKGHHSITLPSANLALAQRTIKGTFADTDGILGLAFSQLNPAHRMNSLTFPWHPEWAQRAQHADFVHSVVQQPRHNLIPLFDDCAAHGLIPDQFAFLVHRSSVFHSNAELNQQALMSHPLNRGLLALGTPRLHTGLHRNDFTAIPLVCDKYYNTELQAITVQGQPTRNPPPFQSTSSKGQNSNSFFDSGASYMVLPESLFEQIIADLSRCAPSQANLLAQYKTYADCERGVDLAELDLAQWPDIHFDFAGVEGASTRLTLTPHSYWQTHAPLSNQASFKLTFLPGWQAQTIIGLPMFCEYYTIFNRRAGGKGQLEFASAQVAPHRFSDGLLHNWQVMKQRLSHLLP